eukprot:GDKJ01020060.1.p1 GENE.GDKJ01020060.1~~GDKJ01020060.1.p1  ORF type:complete len:349 (+),score=41.62 GDKJ01020060.1:32-1048(+)
MKLRDLTRSCAAFVCVTIMGVCSGLYIDRLCISRIRDDSAGIWTYVSIFLVCSLCIYAMICFLLMVFSDPGYVTPEFSEKFGDGIPVIDSSSRNMHYVHVYTKCRRCELTRPERAHHCSTCGQCVEQLDHHCPWYGNCIGRRNFKLFVTSLTANLLLCVFIALNCAVRLGGEVKSESDALVFTGLLALGAAFSIGCFVMISLMLNAAANASSTALDKDRSGENPFKVKSPWELLAEVMGPPSIGWLIPVSLPNSHWDRLDQERYEELLEMHRGRSQRQNQINNSDRIPSDLPDGDNLNLMIRGDSASGERQDLNTIRNIELGVFPSEAQEKERLLADR